MSWFVYIIKASDDSYYTGITTDLKRRFKQHSNGSGAKYFKGRKPVGIVYSEAGHDRSSASVREAAIKKLTRLEKERLVTHNIE